MNTTSATDSYLSLLLSLPQLKPASVLSIFFLTLARLLPIVTLAPFLGSKNVPASIRILFSIALLAIFLPQNLLLAQGEDLAFSMTFIACLLKEIFIGLVLGFLASIPFLVAQMAGTLVDFQRGASSLQVSDPTTQTQTGPIGLLCNFTLLALFYTLGGPFIYLDAVADSYRLVPVVGILQTPAFQQGSPFWTQVISLISTMFKIACQLAAPALIGVLITDLFLGIANRLAPQVQIVFLGMALKSWVGIALFTAAWALMIQVMGGQAIIWFDTLRKIIQQALQH